MNGISRPGYPRKVATLNSLGKYTEITVNDVLSELSVMVALFQVGGWSTREMRMQVFEAFKPYLHPYEDTWIFGFHAGKYQAKKALWHYAGYASASWSDLLDQIVRYYYTYA